MIYISSEFVKITLQVTFKSTNSQEPEKEEEEKKEEEKEEEEEKQEEEKEEEGKGELSTAWTAAANMATEAGVVAGRKGESDLG